MTPTRTVLVPPARLVRWFDNFSTRHGSPESRSAKAASSPTLPWSAGRAALPFRQVYDGPPTAEASGGRPMPRSGGVSCSCARAGSRLPRERRTSPWSRRSGSGTCRGGPRRAVRASSGSPGDATTRHAAPTRPRRTTRIASFSPSSGRSRHSSAADRGAVDAVLADPRLRGLAARRTEPWLAASGPAAAGPRPGDRRRPLGVDRRSPTRTTDLEPLRLTSQRRTSDNGSSVVDAARDEGVAERIRVPERADDQRHREGTGWR